MTKITSDWHIHSRNSCDEASMPVSDLVADAEKTGISDFGLTDHIHTPFNLPDLEASRAEFLACEPAPQFHFGVEASCVSEWELEEVASGRHEKPVYGVRAGGKPGCELALGLNAADIERLKIEFVVAGAHWPMYCPMEPEALIRDYHRQNMFLACHELVDAVAHPWWWGGGGGGVKRWMDPDEKYRSDPWFDDFRKAIPGSMHDEFAAAAKEHGKAIEINVCAMLLSRKLTERFVGQYLEYLAELKGRGASLCIGSDCHHPQYDIDFLAAGRLLASVGITEKDLSFPAFRRRNQ